MKLRIRDNSLRFRLAQGEVETLRERGAVRGRSEFPGAVYFSYAVEARAGSAGATAVFERDGVYVRVPKVDISRWSLGDEVSLSYDVETDSGGSLRVLVEKDFACLTPRTDEDESDLYPHPKAGTGRC